MVWKLKATKRGQPDEWACQGAYRQRMNSARWTGECGRQGCVDIITAHTLKQDEKWFVDYIGEMNLVYDVVIVRSGQREWQSSLGLYDG